jgi:hypothetical protein
VSHPRFLTESAVLAWCGRSRAINTVRNRLSRVCTLLRWCVRRGEAELSLVEALSGRDNPLRQIPRLYGKVQAPRPARWLSHEEAFDRLVGACRDGTDLRLRDEDLIRLGLAGMGAAEIIHWRSGTCGCTSWSLGSSGSARSAELGASYRAQLSSAPVPAVLGRPSWPP